MSYGLGQVFYYCNVMEFWFWILTLVSMCLTGLITSLYALKHKLPDRTELFRHLIILGTTNGLLMLFEIHSAKLVSIAIKHG